MSKLTDIDPKNLAMQRSATSHAAAKKPLEYVSTQKVIENQPFDTEKIAPAYQAQAGMEEHVNFIASAVGADKLRNLRSELQPVAEQLNSFSLPDVAVNIDNQKIEIPYEVRQYANDVDPELYLEIIAALGGKQRGRSLKGFMLKANQVHTPGLWLNQKVWIETKKPYVYLLGREEESQQQLVKERLNEVSEEQKQKAEHYLSAAMGPALFTALKQIAEVTKLPTFAVFVLIVDNVIRQQTVVHTPTTANDAWSIMEGED